MTYRAPYPVPGVIWASLPFPTLLIDETATILEANPAAETFLRFKCDVHPWMFSYITVVDHPYFAVTGKDGTFTIKDVPPGKYKIVALHRKAAKDGVEQDIEVTADGAKLDFALDVK